MTITVQSQTILQDLYEKAISANVHPLETKMTIVEYSKELELEENTLKNCLWYLEARGYIKSKAINYDSNGAPTLNISLNPIAIAFIEKSSF